MDVIVNVVKIVRNVMIKLKDLIKEADAHPQILKKNKEVAHN